MNVINVGDVERQLLCLASAAIHSPAKQWTLSVARNHILGKVSEKDVLMNFRPYDPHKHRKTHFGEAPPPDKLPDWAKTALENGEELHWFDTVQVMRRPLWQAVETVILWFNTWPADDKRLRRIDRINFDTAIAGAAMWFRNVSENIWDYVKDKPPVVKTYENGFRWVRLVTALHFEREGRMMGHCIASGSYYDRWRSAKSEYYSLRDSRNEPHCTVELAIDMRKKGSVIQCKGKTNRKPAANYQPYLRRFFDDMGWTITGDLHNID